MKGIALAILGVVLCCCTAAVGQVRLQGAGATFPAPIYQRWVVEFERVRPGIRIDYQSIGSGGGVRGVIERTVDFGASDAPLNSTELGRMPSEVVHIPTVAGAVVPAYNLPEVDRLNLTGGVLADIYRGDITRWNDPAIAEINPDVELPNLAITPIWRTDGSGTTYVFTSYLAGQSEEFLWRVGYGKAVRWPVGRGGKGNEGVTAMVQRIRGAIGYVELNYASQLGLTHAHVRNREGRFVQATPESVSAAGAGAVDQMTETLAVNIWDQPGDGAYPISAFTYIIVYRDLSQVGDRREAQALLDFLHWATHEGQASAAAMDYAPLAPPVQARVSEVLAGLTWRGERLAVSRRGAMRGMMAEDRITPTPSHGTPGESWGEGFSGPPGGALTQPSPRVLGEGFALGRLCRGNLFPICSTSDVNNRLVEDADEPANEAGDGSSCFLKEAMSC